MVTTDYLLDPDGACGYMALEEGLKDGETGMYWETAHPAKFKETVEQAISSEVTIPQTLQEFMSGEKQSIALSAEFAEFKSFLLNR